MMAHNKTEEQQQNNTMADTDIPVAYAAPMAPPGNAPSRPSIARGRSERLNLPRQQSKKMDAAQIRAMKEQGFTTGLAEAMTKNNAAFPLRIWVVDNSGSMSKGDGHRFIETKNTNQVKVVSCTRWAEIQETVDYHSEMAALLQAPTVFRLLNDPGSINGPQQFSIAERGEAMIPEDLKIAHKTMRCSPSGVTPLSEHVREIRENVQAMEPSLLQSGTRVAIILATDGLPTDFRGMADERSKREFVESLRSLEGLPVWVVIRLCTDEDDVVEFYNELDSQLELSLEVLDDFIGEAKEVYEHNKWLNYALPLHRCRELGYHHRLFDLLDERAFTHDEVREFLGLLFGEDQFDAVPDPQADWKGFVSDVDRIVKKENNQWNPISKKVQPWVDMKKLNKVYGGGSCCLM